LYALGEFELALIYYYRGKNLREDIKEFLLGVIKTNEAIDNCVGGIVLFIVDCIFLIYYL